MTAILGRFCHRAARGLILTMALSAVCALAVDGLAMDARAGAAIDPHIRHVRHLEHVAHIGYARKIGNAGKSSQRDANGGHSQPWKIEIPSIGVSADLMTLGNQDWATLPVPPLAKAVADAGWYRFTSVPGTAGNAVIVGHVDTYVGPAVFYSLYLLHPGDIVYVDLGAVRERFAVRSIRELPKTRFPVNQVFGGTGKHQLWLITCGGDFDYETRHYLDNILVSAEWRPSVRHLRTRAIKQTRAHSASRHDTHQKILVKHSGNHKKNAHRLS
jgi:LPXTG-site transpeptidase (sortase) family protein